MEILDSAEVLERHLAALVRLDPRLAPIRAVAGEIAIRRQPGGFAGLARAICGQQLSTASAAAIWGRFAALPGATEPEGYLGLSEADIRGVGFSAGKFRTVGGIARAVVEGRLDFDRLAGLPAETAITELTALPGVGPWTAEIYLMFSLGHPDVFPAGDLALQVGVQQAFGLDARPPGKVLIEIARAWSPHRHAAALLFWRHYALLKKREGLPL